MTGDVAGLGSGPSMDRPAMFTVAPPPTSTRDACPRSIVGVLGDWMTTPGSVPCIVRLVVILTCSVYVAGAIWMVSPPTVLAALTAAWMVWKTVGLRGNAGLTT